jgi:hypothetical protein
MRIPCWPQNAYGFPQDREVLYNLYPAEDGSVLWEVRVHGQYYQVKKQL